MGALYTLVATTIAYQQRTCLFVPRKPLSALLLARVEAAESAVSYLQRALESTLDGGLLDEFKTPDSSPDPPRAPVDTLATKIVLDSSVVQELQAYQRFAYTSTSIGVQTMEVSTRCHGVGVQTTPVYTCSGSGGARVRGVRGVRGCEGVRGVQGGARGCEGVRDRKSVV